MISESRVCPVCGDSRYWSLGIYRHLHRRQWYYHAKYLVEHDGVGLRTITSMLIVPATKDNTGRVGN